MLRDGMSGPPGHAPGLFGWTVDWQRHHPYLAQLLAAGARPADIIPGVTRHGEDKGRWLATSGRAGDGSPPSSRTGSPNSA